MVKAIWQAAKELAIPAVIAAGLTIFVMDRSPQPEGGWSIVLLATTFFGVFGSAAFVTNQIFLARNQKATDRSLNSIIDRLQGVLGELDAKTTDLDGQITGGKSCPVLMGLPDHPKGPAAPHLAVLGKYSQRDVRIEITEMPFDGTLPFVSANHVVGDVIFGHYTFLPANILDGQKGDHRRLHIRFTALNGTHRQFLHLRRVDGEWRAARRVMAHGEILLERNDDGYPQQPDWIEDMRLSGVILGGKPYIPAP